ncbi:MAG: protein kinase [Deltaproteobacteria bacterium]|nr:protein kinase [Deltaproteobacteria bacterium]
MSEDFKLRTDNLETIGPGADPLVGKVLAGRYRVLQRLGGGGMGSVYEGQHLLIGRRVAIKLLHAEHAARPESVRRFLNEARAAGMLGHPNILESTDMGTTEEGSPFLVLELLEGHDLQTEIEASGPLEIGRVVRIALQVTSALAAAHAKGIVHRDLKPENVFLTSAAGRPDHVKVLDFGISKFSGDLGVSAGTRTGAVFGSPHYMPPEQINDASKADARTDIYAVGVILYNALTGAVPFDAETIPALFIQIAMAPTPSVSAHRPDVPQGLAAAIERAMSKRPDDRFQTMEEVAAVLEPFAGLDGPVVVRASATVLPAIATVSGASIATVPPTITMVAGASTASHQPRAIRWGVWVGAGAVVALAAAAGGTLWVLHEAPQRTTATPAAVPQGAKAAPGPGPAEPWAPAKVPSTTSPGPSGPPPREEGAWAKVPLSVVSPDPGARVRLRGEEHPLPFVAEINPGTEPETIVVTAPMRQGRRFLVSIDRARSLTVSLPHGGGIGDATLEERERALAGPGAASEEATERGPRVGQRPFPATRATAEPVTPAPATRPTAEPPTPGPAAPAPPAEHPRTTAPGVWTGPTKNIPDSI